MRRRLTHNVSKFTIQTNTNMRWKTYKTKNKNKNKKGTISHLYKKNHFLRTVLQTKIHKYSQPNRNLDPLLINIIIWFWSYSLKVQEFPNDLLKSHFQEKKIYFSHSLLSLLLKNKKTQSHHGHSKGSWPQHAQSLKKN